MPRGFLSRENISRIATQVLGDLLPNQIEQSIYEQSVVQRYTIGSPKVSGGRKFRYSQAEDTLAGLARLVINSNYCPGCTGHENEDGFEGVLNSAAPIGSSYVDLKDTALRAANYYKDGFLAIYGVAIFHQHKIVASAPGNGTYVRVWLDEPITTEAVTVAMGVTAYISSYSAIAPAGSVQAGFETFMGVNLIPVTSGRFFWLQTGGPCILTPTGGVWPGSAANLRQVYANPADGTIQPGTQSDPSHGFQSIGYLWSATGGSGADYGDLWVMLMLDQ